MAGIFICYRREDTGGEAGRVYDRLSTHFGDSRVFRDVDTIRPGELFPRAIEERLAHCNVVLALIGRRWLQPRDIRGASRLDRTEDFVRVELATAFQRGVPVIPVLFRNTRMPSASELPSDLEPLATCHAIEINDADFHEDVSRLIAVLDPLVPAAGPHDLFRRRWRGYVRRAVRVGAVVVLLPLSLLILDRSRTEMATSGPGNGGANEESTEVLDPPTVSLRPQPNTVSPDGVRALIIERNYFSTRTNPAGSGIPVDYQARVVQGTAVVVDRTTGLMWDQGGSGRIIPGGQAGAAERIAALNQETFGGFQDWRLPTLDEALALMAPDGQPDFHLPPQFDAGGAPFIWTADAESPERGWVVYYFDGVVAPEVLEFNGYVRAVRTVGGS